MTDTNTYTTIEQCQDRLDIIEPLMVQLATAGADVPSHEDYDTFKAYHRERQGLQHRINQIKIDA